MALPTILRRHPADLLIATEAFVLLVAFRVALRLVPVRRILGAVAHLRSDAPIKGALAQQSSSASEEVNAVYRRVRWAIDAVSRHSPVEFVCFPQAFAGYMMLRRRGIPSIIVYGVRRSEAGDLIAHAWLTASDLTLLGGEAAAGFTAIEQWT
jgi:Transglutaminase-like superfamily